MTSELQQNIDPVTLLAWHMAMGADEAIDSDPIDRFTAPSPQPIAAAPAVKPPVTGPTPVTARPVQPASGATAEEAASVASACKSLEELDSALKAFDGGLLKRSAKNTVCAGGVAGAPLMVVGDVPGREDDQSGSPFSGPQGELLDKMLAAIGFSRSETAYLTTLVPWRPLGNSKPDANLLAICKPFTERRITLANPRVILTMGGAPGKALFNTQDSISRQRGRWQDLTIGGQTFAAIATYHPTYLLTQPDGKKATWQDLLTVKDKLSL